MTIPNPTLDNLSFNEIFAKIRAKIPTYSKTWTNFNYSDPGITFLDLFSWLAENKIYSLNHIPKRNYLKFLKMLGFTPMSPQPLRVIANFEKPRTQFEVKKGSLLKSNLMPDLMLVVDNAADIVYVDLKKILLINLIVPLERYHSSDSSKKETFEKYRQIEFDPDATEDLNIEPFVSDKGLCLGLDIKLTKSADKNNSEQTRLGMFVSIKHYLDDIYPIGEHCGESFVDDIGFVTWEYLYNAGDDKVPKPKWTEFKKEDIEDGTLGLTKSGIISFKTPFKENDRFDLSYKLGTKNRKPDNSSGVDDSKLFWIRCVLKKNSLYDEPPISIDSIVFNCVTATQGAKTEEVFPKDTRPDQDLIEKNLGPVLLTVPALPNQQLQLSHYPVIRVDSIEVIPTKTDLGYYVSPKQIWTCVDDFGNSQPTNSHYTVDYNNGIISFGDGRHGRTPPMYSKILVRYVHGEPKTSIDTQIALGLFEEAQGHYLGDSKIQFILEPARRQEELEELKSRAKRNLMVPTSAITLGDIEYITKNTPQLRIARSAARRGSNEIEVVIIPVSNSKKPMPTNHLIKSVCRHLDKHRLVTTPIRVSPPKYVEISVIASIKTSAKLSPAQIISALESFLTPISHSLDYEGWPIGKTVYRSEIISEIEKIAGVDCIESLTLNAKSDEGGLYKYSHPNIEIHPSAFAISGQHIITITHVEPSCLPKNDQAQSGELEGFEKDEPACKDKGGVI